MHPRRAIQRYVSGELGKRGEAALRRHLKGCEPCRSYYEAQIVLLRVLEGTGGEPTLGEDERLLALMMERAQAEDLFSEADRPARASTKTPSDSPSLATRLLDRLVLRPLPGAFAAAFALVLIVSASLLLSSGSGLLDAVLPPVPVARLVEARGLILEGRSLGAEEARDMVLHEGEGMVIEAGGLAELSLTTGGNIRIFPGTRTRLEEGGRLVLLDRGRVWCQVDASESPFVVRTPGGEARVLGTSFVVEHGEEGKTGVRVIEGRVEVVDSAGRGKVEVAAGRQTSIALGGSPSEPVRYDTRQDESEWSGLWGRLIEALQRALDGVRGVFDSEP